MDSTDRVLVKERWFPTLLCWIRKVKPFTKRDAVPVIFMEKCVHSLDEAAVFSTLGATWRYWQAQLENKDRDNTVFTSHPRLYLSVRMPSGLRNTSTKIQRKLRVALSSVRWKFLLVQLHKIGIFFCFTAEHINYVKYVSTLWRMEKLPWSWRTIALFFEQLTTRNVLFAQHDHRIRRIRRVPPESWTPQGMLLSWDCPHSPVMSSTVSYYVLQAIGLRETTVYKKTSR